ncbi:hypothetical protein [uncultured Desulfovibrio sp.]|uniref:hypothetical protein n=1 Tax=uncultured Desulfovibrio sp. TaxID=167968 RepID=UPI0026066930|nr:hypothetical protein [uncultured Desulfovibrio sp.]
MKIASLVFAFLAVTFLLGGGLAHAWSPMPTAAFELQHHGHGGGHGGYGGGYGGCYF